MAKIIPANVKTIVEESYSGYDDFELADVELNPFNLAVALAPVVFAFSPRLFFNGVVVGLFTKVILETFQSRQKTVTKQEKQQLEGEGVGCEYRC